MTGRPTITAALITRNEAPNLRELLPQLGWVDEVVVVDGGSGDGTADVARSYGCRVDLHRFEGFAEQRNRAIELSRSDWILSLDADERPTGRLIDEIGRAMIRDRHAAYRIAIRSEILGRAVRRGGTQDDRPIRLFRRTAARWVGDVHEVLAVRGRVSRLEGWLAHRTLSSHETFLQKIDLYTALEAAARVRAGRAPRLLAPAIAPPREVFRRLIYKLGLLDGPAGWEFAVLSGYSEWMLAHRHRRLWAERQSAAPTRGALPARDHVL